MADLLIMLMVFVVSFFVGHLFISKIPQLLHTPLMSMTNAISAVTILGAFLLYSVETTPLERVVGATAMAMAAFNVVGGFVITDRMLKLFRKNHPME